MWLKDPTVKVRGDATEDWREDSSPGGASEGSRRRTAPEPPATHPASPSAAPEPPEEPAGGAEVDGGPQSHIYGWEELSEQCLRKNLESDGCVPLLLVSASNLR